MSNRFTDKHKLILTKALKKYGNPEGIQNIYELEGFLVGALCCPERTTMDDMMFAIFGPEEAHPEWKNEAEVRDFFDSLFALQNKNNSLLRGALYRPKLLKDEKEHKKWCQGFIKGFCPEGLEEARQLSDNKSILTFLTVVAAISGIDVLATPGSTKKDYESLSVFLEGMTTKILASGVHDLFVTFRLAESHHHCCDGEHHHHHEEGMLH